MVCLEETDIDRFIHRTFKNFGVTIMVRSLDTLSTSPSLIILQAYGEAKVLKVQSGAR